MSHAEGEPIHTVEKMKQVASVVTILFLGILCPVMALPVIGGMITENAIQDMHESMAEGGGGH